jgi:hypothetical protein
MVDGGVDGGRDELNPADTSDVLRTKTIKFASLRPPLDAWLHLDDQSEGARHPDHFTAPRRSE